MRQKIGFCHNSPFTVSDVTCHIVLFVVLCGPVHSIVQGTLTWKMRSDVVACVLMSVCVRPSSIGSSGMEHFCAFQKHLEHTDIFGLLPGIAKFWQFDEQWLSLSPQRAASNIFQATGSDIFQIWWAWWHEGESLTWLLFPHSGEDISWWGCSKWVKNQNWKATEMRHGKEAPKSPLSIFCWLTSPETGIFVATTLTVNSLALVLTQRQENFMNHCLFHINHFLFLSFTCLEHRKCVARPRVSADVRQSLVRTVNPVDETERRVVNRSILVYAIQLLCTLRQFLPREGVSAVFLSCSQKASTRVSNKENCQRWVSSYTNDDQNCGEILVIDRYIKDIEIGHFRSVHRIQQIQNDVNLLTDMIHITSKFYKVNLPYYLDLGRK